MMVASKKETLLPIYGGKVPIERMGGAKRPQSIVYRLQCSAETAVPFQFLTNRSPGPIWLRHPPSTCAALQPLPPVNGEKSRSLLLSIEAAP